MFAIEPAAKVGVAPSTTTIHYGRRRLLGNVQNVPKPSVAERQAAMAKGVPAWGRTAHGMPTGLRGAAERVRAYYPYATPGDFKSALGVVDPNDAFWTGRAASPPSMAIQLNGSNLGVVDPNDSFWTGRAASPPSMAIQLEGPGLGLVTDEVNRVLTGLGTVPNDDELSIAYGGGYTPYHSGWVDAVREDGSAYHAAGLYGTAQLGNPLLAQATNDERLLDSVLSLQRKQLWMQAISTIAIAALATVGIIKAFGK